MDNYNVPSLISDRHQIDISPRPTLSSLIFVHPESDFLSFKARYICGMRDVYCTTDPINLNLPSQSLSVILYEAIMKLLFELQRVLSNRRKNQEVFSSFSLSISSIIWDYLKEKMQIPVDVKEKVCSFCLPSGRDLSITKVKARYDCHVLRLEDNAAVHRLVSIFGVCSVAGARKRPPALSKRLGRRQSHITMRGGVQLLDVINLVGVQDNNRLHPGQNGRKGIDLIYTPEQQTIRISVRYKKLIVQDALEKLRQLGVATVEDGEPLTDDELERISRGNI